MSTRCQHSGPRGQCTHQSVTGSDFCKKHGNEADRIRSYRLADPDLRERFDHHSGSASLRTVKEEVLLMRALLDERVAMAKSEAEKIAAFPVLQAAASNLSKMVETLQKLERQTSVVLDKGTLEKLLDEIVEILVSELANVEGSESIIDRVASRIGDAIAESHNQE